MEGDGKRGMNTTPRHKNLISYRQDKPLRTSEKGKAEERGTVSVMDHARERRQNKMDLLVSSNLEMVCGW